MEPTITADIVVAYDQCPRKAYLLLFSPDKGEPVWSKNSNAPFPQSLRSSHHPLLLLHYTLMCTILISNEW